MKKTLTTIALVGATLGAFAQGTVLFENSLGTGNVSFSGGSSPSAASPAGTYDVALLFNPATSTAGITQAQLTQVAFYAPAGTGNGAGYFYDPATVTTPSGTGSGVFEVVAWAGGSFTTWAAASAAGSGVTYLTTGANLVEFVNSMGSNPANPPATAAVPLSGTGGTWNGNLVLTPVPEPTTIALGGLGAAALMMFRRRK
jgi:hypothetical protein